jgi:hypothetical protein
MKIRKLLLTLATVVLAVVVLVLPALANTGLWTKITGTNAAVKANFTSGTGSAPTDRQPDGGVISTYTPFRAGYAIDGGITSGPVKSGIALEGATGLAVTVETLNGPIPGNDAGLYLDGGTLSSGTLQAYLYDPAASRWSRAPDLDLTVTSGLASQSFTGFTVTQPVGRIAYVPNGLGQPVNVYLSTTSPHP